jgi:reversibly glycosylated polypeptide/UDP-arabinopyranose mutase
MKTALVVPSNRPAEVCKFLEAWQPYPWHETIVTADLAEPLPEVADLGAICVCWKDIEALGTDAWIFSRRDSAVRCFGFLVAAHRGADVVVTLDDDCRPNGNSAAFLRGHLSNLFETPPWASSVPGLHVRGIPYRLDEHAVEVEIAVSMGLWRGVADLDAPHQLLGFPGVRNFEPPGGTRVMSCRQFFPFCGMNFAFRRDALPALYFPPMGQGSPFCRFDDIWGGLVLQCILARIGRSITVGEPFVQHQRASDPLRNLVREAPGIEANETVWHLLWPALKGHSADVSSAVREVAAILHSPTDASPLASYLRRWGDALEVWLRLCQDPPHDCAPTRGVPAATS